MVRKDPVESQEYQFPEKELENPAKINHLEGYTIKPLSKSDYDNGYLEVLSQLTTVGNICKKEFEERFDVLKKNNHIKYFIVAKRLDSNKVVAAGSLLLDYKFIHDCGYAGHIEDIVVSSTERGKNLGKCIVKTLIDLAADIGVYKVVLSCSNNNKKFYERCGMESKELTLFKYFRPKI